MREYDYCRYNAASVDITSKMNEKAKDGWVVAHIHTIPGADDHHARVHVLWERDGHEHLWCEQSTGAELGAPTVTVCAICGVYATQEIENASSTA